MVKRSLSLLLLVLTVTPLHASTGHAHQPVIKAQEAAAVQPPPAFLPTGTELQATITNAIFSFNLATPVIAKINEDVAFLNKVVLPKGTKILGKALVLKSHDRVNINFNLAVLPDGTELDIQGLALSPDGSAGIPGHVEKYRDSRVASAALQGAVMGATTLPGANVNPVLSQTGQAVANETANEVDIARDQVDTSVSVSEFTECMIYFERRLERHQPKEEANNALNHPKHDGESRNPAPSRPYDAPQR